MPDKIHEAFKQEAEEFLEVLDPDQLAHVTITALAYLTSDQISELLQDLRERYRQCDNILRNYYVNGYLNKLAKRW